MTRILLSLIIIFSFHSIASAQFKKGDILLGGQLSYNHYSYYNDYTNSTVPPQQKSEQGNFIISAAKSIKENTVIGINLSYSPYSSDNYYYINNALKYSSNSYSVGIFYPKYKGLGKEFYVFGEANAFYSESTEAGKDTLGFKPLNGTA